MSRFIEGRHYAIDTTTGCWNWLRNIATNGYGRVTVDHKGTWAHRVAYAEHQPIPDGWHIHHTCNNRRCINPAHLVAIPFAVHAELHAEDKGKKLTPELARQVRTAVAERRSHHEIAHDYGVTESTVRDIANGSTWLRAGGFTPRQDTACIVCGAVIPGTRRRTATTCSGKCRTRLYRERHANAA